MSLETEYWLKGYLAGCEPDPPTDEDDDVSFGSEEYKRWEREIDLFHKTGCWYEGVKTCEECGSILLRSWVGMRCEKCMNRDD